MSLVEVESVEVENVAVCNDHSDLIGLDVFEAMRIKFDRGRKRYGEESWVGPPALVCAHDEILDFLVYVDQAIQKGAIGERLGHELMKTGVDLRQGIQTAISVWRAVNGATA
jgi:hypothetical protein